MIFQANGFVVDGKPLIIHETDSGFAEIVNESGNNTIRVDIIPEIFDDPDPQFRVSVFDGSLTLTGRIVDEDSSIPYPAHLVKRGAGTFRLASLGGHFINGDVRVEQGTVELAYAPNFRLTAAALRIGVATTGTTAEVHLTNDGQLSLMPIFVDLTGLLNLNGHAQTVGTLTLSGGTVRTGGGALTLATDVISQQSAVSARVEGNVNLGNGTRTFNVANGTASRDMAIDAVISGGVGLVKTGSGTLAFEGATPNNYTGTTTVRQGTLLLDKQDGVTAVTGPLVIGDGQGGANADRVLLGSRNQIRDGASVQILSSGRLDLANRTETIGPLTMTGGSITSGSRGLLTLGGAVTTNASSAPAIITGQLATGSASRSFNIGNGLASPDLRIDAGLTSGGLVKNGPGTLELTAVSGSTGNTVLLDGTLKVSGALSGSRVVINGGSLSGAGSVSGITGLGGSVSPGDGIGTLTSTASVRLDGPSRLSPQVIPTVGDPHDRLVVRGTVDLNDAILNVVPQFLSQATAPFVRVIDDGDPAFTVTTGWSRSTGSGFGDDFHRSSAGDGTNRAAWTFSGLAPGQYRVSATWASGTNRATNAPFTLFDGLAPLTTQRVNQKLTPADFTTGGGTTSTNWEILADVRVESGTLKVELSNDADGLVVADALFIERSHFVIVENDGNDPVEGTFANLPEGTVFPVKAVNPLGSLQHQFYRITYRANDGNDVGLFYITTSTAVEDLQVTPSRISEGEEVWLTGKLTDPDPGDFLTLMVDWGDGSPAQSFHPGLEPFRLAHRYDDNPTGQPEGGHYTITATWFDQHGKGNSRQLQAVVHNAAPVIEAGGDAHVKLRSLFARNTFFTDLGKSDHWTAVVDFGDGSGTQLLKPNPAKRLKLRHRFREAGVYVVTVTVLDDDGGLGRSTFRVFVD